MSSRGSNLAMSKLKAELSRTLQVESGGVMFV